MSSHQSGRTGPFWHPQFGQHWYDVQLDCLIYVNGATQPRPINVPRDYYLDSRNTVQLPAYEYGGSPPGRDAPYIAAPGPNPNTGSSRPNPSSNAAHQSTVPGFERLTLGLGQGVRSGAQQRTGTNVLQTLPNHHLVQQTRHSEPSSSSTHQYQRSATARPPTGRSIEEDDDDDEEDEDDEDEDAEDPDENESAGSPNSQPRHAPAHFLAGPTQANVTEAGSARFVNAYNDRTQVETRFQTAPPQDITDASLYQSGITAYRMLVPTGSRDESEQLFDSFRVREQPRKFFTVGKVFMVLWVEPLGESRTMVTGYARGTTKGRYGELVFSKVRRFVVIREGHNYCSALPIATYGKQGTGKKGVIKHEHAIIYSGKQVPQSLPSEQPMRGERGMRTDAIRVDLDDKEDKLDPLSRLDFGKVHTIHHNIKVRSYGVVNPKSQAALLNQFANSWNTSPASIATPSAALRNTGHPESSRRSAGETRPAPASRKDSVSSGPKLQQTRMVKDGSSQGRSQQNITPRISQTAGINTPQGSSSAGQQNSDAATQLQRRQQVFWNVVQQYMDSHGCSREEAAKRVRDAALADQAHRNAQATAGKSDDDDDDDDDDDEEEEEEE